jgi:hypothetical protein
MTNVIRHITGIAAETGFAKYGRFGSPDDPFSFGDLDFQGFTFCFGWTDTDAIVID